MDTGYVECNVNACRVNVNIDDIYYCVVCVDITTNINKDKLGHNISFANDFTNKT
jgi:hypothetical protein